MLPLAPARLSTTTLCPSDSVIAVAASRDTKSSPPPAPDETVMRMGLVGYAACAVRGDANTANKITVVSAMATRMFAILMV